MLEHSLHNAGLRRIDVRHDNHNFLTIDHHPSGRDFEIQLPFHLEVERPADPLHICGNRMSFHRLLDEHESAIAELRGYGERVSDYNITVINKRSGTDVEVRGDRPLVKLLFWAKRGVLCPAIHSNQPGAGRANGPENRL